MQKGGRYEERNRGQRDMPAVRGCALSSLPELEVSKLGDAMASHCVCFVNTENILEAELSALLHTFLTLDLRYRGQEGQF